MSDKVKMMVVFFSGVMGVTSLVGSVVLFALGMPEAGASVLATSAVCGVAALVAKVGNNGSALALLGASALATTGCGAVCDIYDTGHAASCALCEAARGSGAECEGPACVACDATRAPCPFESEEDVP